MLEKKHTIRLAPCKIIAHFFVCGIHDETAIEGRRILQRHVHIAPPGKYIGRREQRDDVGDEFTRSIRTGRTSVDGCINQNRGQSRNCVGTWHVPVLITFPKSQCNVTFKLAHNVPCSFIHQLQRVCIVRLGKSMLVRKSTVRAREHTCEILSHQFARLGMFEAMQRRLAQSLAHRRSASQP